MFGYIYLTENLINGKCYIGKRSNPYFDTKYKGSGKLLRSAFKKYGWENFICSVIEYCNSKTELEEKEKYWIEKCNAVESPYFYNIAPGGIGGATRGIGWHQGNNQKIICSLKNTGRKHTEKEKAKMKINHKDFHRGNHPQAKKVLCVDTGKVYQCINDAMDDTGIDRHKISNSCKGVNKSGISELKFIFI